MACKGEDKAMSEFEYAGPLSELIVLGDSIIHHLVNGDTVLTYTQPQIGGDLPEGFPLLEGTLLSSGYIALQAESHPFHFRKVELLDLSEEYE